MTRYLICPTCDGWGVYEGPAHPDGRCGSCAGIGRVPCPPDSSTEPCPDCTVPTPCRKCDGKGETRTACRWCRGTGEAARTLNVEPPRPEASRVPLMEGLLRELRSERANGAELARQLRALADLYRVAVDGWQDARQDLARERETKREEVTGDGK